MSDQPFILETEYRHPATLRVADIQAFGQHLAAQAAAAVSEPPAPDYPVIDEEAEKRLVNETARLKNLVTGYAEGEAPASLVEALAKSESQLASMETAKKQRAQMEADYEDALEKTKRDFAAWLMATYPHLIDTEYISIHVDKKNVWDSRLQKRVDKTNTVIKLYFERHTDSVKKYWAEAARKGELPGWVREDYPDLHYPQAALGEVYWIADSRSGKPGQKVTLAAIEGQFVSPPQRSGWTYLFRVEGEAHAKLLNLQDLSSHPLLSPAYSVFERVISKTYRPRYQSEVLVMIEHIEWNEERSAWKYRLDTREYGSQEVLEDDLLPISMLDTLYPVSVETEKVLPDEAANYNPDPIIELIAIDPVAVARRLYEGLLQVGSIPCLTKDVLRLEDVTCNCASCTANHIIEEMMAEADGEA